MALHERKKKSAQYLEKESMDNLIKFGICIDIDKI